MFSSLWIKQTLLKTFYGIAIVLSFKSYPSLYFLKKWTFYNIFIVRNDPSFKLTDYGNQTLLMNDIDG